MPDKDDSSRFEQSVDNEEEVLRHLVGVTDGDGVGDVDIRLDVPAKLLLLWVDENDVCEDNCDADGRFVALLNVPRLSKLLTRSRPRSSRVLGLNSALGLTEASLVFS